MSALGQTRTCRGRRDDAATRSRRRGSLIVTAAAFIFAVAWAFGLWLIVLLLLSAAAVLARQRVLARRGLPARLVAWAEHAPCGPATPVALEHAVSVDLAAISEGDLDALERAQAVLADTVEDPWRRALGEERLSTAHRLVARGALVGIRRRGESPLTRLRRGGAAVSLIALVALGALSQSRWWLVPTAVAHALVALEFVALYERRWVRPELLASRSVRDPVEGLFVMPEEAVARSLVTLANSDPVVIQRARHLLEASGPHAHARRRLDEAERLLAHRRGNRPGTRLGAWLVVVTAPAAANGTWWGTP